eukprot:TRINITY_DN48057_c0_g1_i1.p1 TRINITY_DN48057_c0_g1~~TRINITY_DN48057_c0_g1_i1.p1  ORF type:complete len:404 (+),score=83.10 TRINITY_DN48057_c0_g1_i1:64-1212(+)
MTSSSPPSPSCTVKGLAPLVAKLHSAVRLNELAIACELLEEGVSVNARGANGGWTPLHVAAGQGNSEIVEMLLAHDADAGARDGDQRTPLAWAEFSGHRSCALALRWKAVGDTAPRYLRRSGTEAKQRSDEAVLELEASRKALSGVESALSRERLEHDECRQRLLTAENAAPMAQKAEAAAAKAVEEVALFRTAAEQMELAGRSERSAQSSEITKLKEELETLRASTSNMRSADTMEGEAVAELKEQLNQLKTDEQKVESRVMTSNEETSELRRALVAANESLAAMRKSEKTAEDAANEASVWRKGAESVERVENAEKENATRLHAAQEEIASLREECGECKKESELMKDLSEKLRVKATEEEEAARVANTRAAAASRAFGR